MATRSSGAVGKSQREREREKKRKKPARIKNHVKIVQFQRLDGILLRQHRELPES